MLTTFHHLNEKEANKTQQLMHSSLTGIRNGGQQSACESLMTSAIINPVVKLENGTSLGEQSTIDKQIPNNCAANATEALISAMDLTEVTENSPPRKKQKQFDAEKIIMGHELSDLEINLAHSNY